MRPKTVIVKSYLSYMWLEVFEILQWKDGLIYKTRTTNKYIEAKFKHLLPTNYTTANLSTSLTKKENIELEIFDLETLC